MIWVKSLVLLALLAKFFTFNKGVLVDGFVVGPTPPSPADSTSRIHRSTYEFSSAGLSSYRDATILFGFRSFLRKGAEFVRPKSIIQDDYSFDGGSNSSMVDNECAISLSRRFSDANTEVNVDMTIRTSVSPQNWSHDEVFSVRAETTKEAYGEAATVATLEVPYTATVACIMEKPESQFLEKPLYTLPPTNRTMNNLEKEFRGMLESFSNYSQRDLMSLRDKNTRTLFEGVAASAHEPAVYRAFEVLFEDLYPLRIASRVIHKKLLKLMEDSKQERERDVNDVVAATGLDPAEVEKTWLMFVGAASKRNKGNYLTKEQLCSAGFLSDLEKELHPAPIDSLLEKFDSAKNRQLGFKDFIIELQNCVSMECSLERNCDSLVVLQNLVHRISTHEGTAEEVISERKQQYGRRYDEMLEAFKVWKPLVPEGEGQVLDVVRGCFVGAENEQVVKALRICYVDYSGLRVAAEIIFKIVKSFMSKRQKAIESKKASS